MDLMETGATNVEWLIKIVETFDTNQGQGARTEIIRILRDYTPDTDLYR